MKKQELQYQAVEQIEKLQNTIGFKSTLVVFQQGVLLTLVTKGILLARNEGQNWEYLVQKSNEQKTTN